MIVDNHFHFLHKAGILKMLFFVFLYCTPSTLHAGNNTDKLLIELENMLAKNEEYQLEKIERIQALEFELQLAKKISNKLHEYEVNNKLYNEYQSFMYDSAYKYVQNMTLIARELNNPELLNKAKIELGFTFLSSGLFKESLDTLKSISTVELDNETKIDYYNVLARTYFDMGIYCNTVHYYTVYSKTGAQIIDSAIMLLSDTTEQYWLAMGQKLLKSGDFANAIDAFNFAISQFELSQHDYAIATSSLGWLYQLFGRDNDAIDMLIKAAIADIKNSTRETVALRELAIILYRKGELDLAYKYINIALDDATFYKARHRKMEISEVLPIIESNRFTMLEKQRKQLINYGFAITALSLVVTMFVLVFYKQLKKVRSIRSILQETNLNLKNMNDMLLETNKIKEEYIGYFFNINSEFITRLENYQKTIRRKIASRQFDDLKDIIRPSELHKERENLFKNFDKIFLNLFPNFIEEFNKLFKPEDQIIVEQNELLSADLRIFALLRLGITDSDKIAKFLNYSVNTIYTYKTKLKHKAIVSKDDFDKKVMAIKPQ